MRTKVKAMSYGLAYGLSAFGLSKQLRIPSSEAKQLMTDYFARFGAVRDYLRQVVEEARAAGYTETIFGRRRPFPDLNSPNRVLRDNAERAALNAPIQGSAADIMKIAMIRIEADMRERDMASRMLLQVHDELILEVAAGSGTRSRPSSPTAWRTRRTSGCRSRCRWAAATRGPLPRTDRGSSIHPARGAQRMTTARLSDLLADGAIRLDAHADDRESAIRQAGYALVAAGAVEPGYVEAMVERERSVSTFVGEGVAVPHGTLAAGRDLVRADAISLLRLPDGVDWDGHDVRIVIGIAATGGGHIALLSRLAEILLDPVRAEQLRGATDPATVRSLLGAATVEG